MATDMATATGAERRAPHACVIRLLPVLTVAALAGLSSAASAQRFFVTPQLSVRETLSDNIRLESGDAKESDAVTQVTPSIRINRTGAGPLKVNADYQLTALFYARNSSANDLQHHLAASANYEAINRFLFIDARARIAQELVDPLGPQPLSSVNITSNRTESRSVQVSPYVRGRAAGVADYLIRYSLTAANTAAAASSSSRVQDLTATLNGVRARYGFNWQLDGRSQLVHHTVGADTRTDRGRANLIYRLNEELEGRVHVGTERNDYTTDSLSARTTYGAGVIWRPGPRTDFQAGWEHRFFGTGWNLSARHRTRLMSIQLNGSRDVQTDAERLIEQGDVTYDILYDALTSRIPDPVQRDLEARRLLAEGGIPTDLLPGQFITPRVYVNQRVDGTLALLGARNTVTMRAFLTDRRTIVAEEGPNAGIPSLRVKERGFTGNWSHRLTPLSTLSLIGSWRRADRDDDAAQSRQWDARLAYSTRVGPHTSLTLEGRHVDFQADTANVSGYRENAITAGVVVRF